jgi:hypothetical protein
MFQSNRREKRGWDTDYPGADINFSVRLAELTRSGGDDARRGRRTRRSSSRLTDDALFQCRSR